MEITIQVGGMDTKARPAHCLLTRLWRAIRLYIIRSRREFRDDWEGRQW
jgi:hypothetical protein